MSFSPKCPECQAFKAKIVEAKIGDIAIQMDISVPAMHAAVAAKDRAKAILLRDQVLKIRDELKSVSNAFVMHLLEHEAAQKPN